MSETNVEQQANIALFREFNQKWGSSVKADPYAAISLDTEKETAQLMYTIDKFFGTQDGYYYEVITPVTYNGKLQPAARKRDDSKPNVFAKLRELKLMLCGGAINSIFTGKSVNDLDFYLEDISKKEEALTWLKEMFPMDHMSTINAVTMKRHSTSSRKKWVVQLITKFHGTPHEIFDWFDFTITHGAYMFSSLSFYFGDRFFQDLAKRRLVYSGSSQYPICAMYRTKKYVERGYELPGATVMHIALSIVQLKIENYRDLKDQLMGIDTMFLQGLLNARDPYAPVNYGEFVFEAFQMIDRISGLTSAEEESENADA